MTLSGSSNSLRNRSVIAASVQSIDSVNGEATAYTRRAGVITVDFSHYVGAIAVTPAIGEQWYVENIDGIYIPRSRIPFNDPNQMAVTPTTGQHVVGSGNGPVTVNAKTQVSVLAPLSLLRTSTSGRPDPTVTPGALIYDNTLSKPIFSTGTIWETMGGTAGVGSGAPVVGETPTGVKNDSNLVFTTSQNFQTGTTAVYRNGLRERIGVGYTESAEDAITFTAAPLSDDDLAVDYIVL